MHFTKKLKKILRVSDSHLCIGLDTDVRELPVFLKSYDDPVIEFNNLIVECTKDLVCAYKLNAAFYERMGESGWNAIRGTLKSIPQEVVTIADAKRGDIENVSERYAQVFLDELGFDAITVHPYMGSDSVRPFIRRKNKFVFLLALTSNYGSGDFQLLKVGKKPLYEIVIEKAQEWNNHKIGFVVGANHTKELSLISREYPDVPMLIPGIGAQKNSLEKVLSSLEHNLFIINQSRSIIYSAPKAKDEAEFKSIIRESALKARDEISGRLPGRNKKF
jgi:orotidine-5'-phosphate decarboxylase